MKTLELNNLPTPVLLVWGFPEDTKEVYYSHNAISYVTNKTHQTKLFPEGRWQLIGRLSELTEEQAKGLVHVGNCSSTNSVLYENYQCGNHFLTALLSFESAIEAEGYFVDNPLGKEPTPENTPNYAYSIHARQWESAQSKTLPANTLIFKRP